MRCTITVWSGRIIFRFHFLLLLHNDFWPTHHPCLHIYNYQRFMKSNNSLVKKPTKNNFWETFPEWFVTLFPFIHIPETGNAESLQKSWSIYQYQIIFSDIIFEFDKSIYINCNDICVLILCCVILNTGEMSEIMFLGWTISPKLFCSDKYYRDPYKVRKIPKFLQLSQDHCSTIHCQIYI